MNEQMIRALLLSVAFLTGCSGLQAAPPDKDAREGKQLAERYTWYDGEQARSVWLDPRLLAEFPGRGAEQSGAVRSVAPQARELPSPQAGVRLWELDGDAEQTLRSLRSTRNGGKFSPVLRDAPGSSGRMRALPGNVVVYVDPQMDERQARAWLAEQRLSVVRKLGFGANVFLVAAEPGLASLELANRLRETPQVKAAMPEWWQEASPR